jgi:hypothetical protein
VRNSKQYHKKKYFLYYSKNFSYLNGYKLRGADKTALYLDSLLTIYINRIMKGKDKMNIEELKELVELKELEKRLELLEKHEIEDSLTLLEILSNITFFGNLKMEKCKYARDGQCGRFFLKLDAVKKIPIATKCRIKRCNVKLDHCHLELSNVTCAFCPEKE